MFKFIVNFFAKRTLRAMLSDERYEFRTLGILAQAIGQSPASTAVLLYQIGARESRRGGQLYGLTSRIGRTGYRRTNNRGIVTG